MSTKESTPGGRIRSPPPSFRPPPPFAAPPPNPLSPSSQRKLSVNAPFRGRSPSPFNRRPVEKIEEQKIARFGEPSSRMNSPLRTLNGQSRTSSEDHADFLDILEKEEEGFAEQLKKQKVFLQTVFKEKDELATTCANQAGKLQRLENERQEWQKKIIEAEREKRDLAEKLTQEEQSRSQSVKKLEKQKRDLEKMQSESSLMAKERNDAVSQLSQEMKEIERLESERKSLFARIDALERQKLGSSANNKPIDKTLAETNLKLKLEIGNIRTDCDKLNRTTENLNKEKTDLTNKLTETSIKLRERDTELKQTQNKLSDAMDSLTSVKNQFDRQHEETKKLRKVEHELKLEATRAKKEAVTNSDGASKLRREVEKLLEERKDHLQKIEDLQHEAKDMKDKITSFESNKQNELKKLELMVKDLKEKLDKYDIDKKAALKVEKSKRETMASKQEQERKEMEEKWDKMKLQFEKAAIESKKKMAQLEEENNKATSIIDDAKSEVAKKEDELRVANRKIKSLESEFQKYKASSKSEDERHTQELETVEQRLIEARKSAEVMKKKMDSNDAEMKRVVDAKNVLEGKVNALEADIRSMKESGNTTLSKVQNEKELVQKELRDAANKILQLRDEKCRLETKANEDVKDFEKTIENLRTDLQNVTLKKDELSGNEKLAKKEDITFKLEKEKREVVIAKDKIAKQLEALESEKEMIKENLGHLEAEKKSNNFGRYEKERLKGDLDKIAEEKERLQARIETLSQERNELQSKIEAMSKGESKHKDELVKANKALLGKTEALEGEKSQLQRNFEMLEEKLNGLERAKADVLRQNQTLTSQITSLESQCKSLQNDKQSTNQGLHAQINNLKTERDKLQATLADLKTKQSATMQELDLLKKELKRSEDAKRELGDQVKKLQLGDKTKILTDRLNQLEKDKLDLEKKVRLLDREKSDLSSKIKPMEKEKITLGQKIRDLEASKNELQKRVSDLEISLKTKHNEEVVKSQYEVRTLKQENQTMKREKDDLCKTLKVVEKDLRKVARDVNQKKVQAQIKRMVEGIEMNTLIPKTEAETTALKDLEELANQLSEKCEEVGTWKSNFEKLQNDFGERTSELECLNSQLQKAKVDGGSAVEKLKKTEDDLAHIKEKNAQLSDELLNKSRQMTAFENQVKGSMGAISNEATKAMEQKIKDLQKKLDEAVTKKPPTERKKSVKFNLEPEQDDSLDKIARLEAALEEASRERKEILEAAEKEIEYHRSIACELEETMVNDFEWKIHEIESDFHQRLKEAQSGDGGSNSRKSSHTSSGTYTQSELDQKLRELKTEITRQKDDELRRMQSQLRKEMDEKLRSDNNSHKESLVAEKQRELEEVKRKWILESKSLSEQLEVLKKEIERKDEALIKAVNDAQSEGDQKAFEERRKATELAEKSQGEMEALRDDLNGQISRIRAEYDEKVENLESRLQVALGAKLEHMMAMKDEVEQEYADRMEELRDMYRDEMDAQTEKFEKERSKMHNLETSLQETLKTKRKEVDELKVRAHESETKVTELTTRLENQTLEVLRLQTELEEYEYEDAVGGTW
ncbi:hypothetical protein TCAL_07117 [Tigriopus californicus]|uniref:Uncharacterized protein n=1 Tax=Tigriopus californicus TaxID=6832 RepID=A0A553PAU0_TIGCA|nr:hypothetical protein TCAL_07117 [Tigriopus californicus]